MPTTLCSTAPIPTRLQACAHRPTLAARTGIWCSVPSANSILLAKLVCFSVGPKDWALSCTSNATCTQRAIRASALSGAKKTSNQARVSWVMSGPAFSAWFRMPRSKRKRFYFLMLFFSLTLCSALRLELVWVTRRNTATGSELPLGGQHIGLNRPLDLGDSVREFWGADWVEFICIRGDDIFRKPNGRAPSSAYMMFHELIMCSHRPPPGCLRECASAVSS